MEKIEFNPLISIRNVSKNYGKKTVVDNINLNIPESCFALLGPNGAGKTTLLLMILGLIKTSTGSIKIEGKEVSTNFKHIRTDIGFLPENIGFYPNLSGLEQIELYCRLRSIKKIVRKSEIKNEAKELLEWKPKISLEEGINKLELWIKENELN